jgi:ABC-type polysaccharide/polyol phosphate transport system ATPase subunit
MAQGPIAIEVEGVSKSFRIPTRRVDTLRERIVAGLRPATEELKVLDEVSFTVPRGEFFGIAGRNGSGKSTLLKIIAGIYRADAGTIRVGGRLAPIIELGVGFNNELPAYDNVLINGVMMGLEPSEIRERYPEILAFSELGEFRHLPLKNYSSGMRARLGFSIMVHVDADLLLFDEVLAVGDQGFQEKCVATFEELRETGRTGILVTHSMPLLRAHCDNAMLIEDGRVVTLGPSAQVAAAYEAIGRLRMDQPVPAGA